MLAECLGFLTGSLDIVLKCSVVDIVGEMNWNAADAVAIFHCFCMVDVPIGTCSSTSSCKACFVRFHKMALQLWQCLADFFKAVSLEHCWFVEASLLNGNDCFVNHLFLCVHRFGYLGMTLFGSKGF